jgi:hypothetical protein
MLVDLIDKLADRIIQLFNYRKQARKTLLDDYITPIIKEFEIVHDAYLDSFKEYRNLIQNATELKSSSSILSTIEKDNLFTANQRAKVFELAKVAEDEVVGKFIELIYRYLVDTRIVNPLSNEEQPDLIYTQLWRQSLIGELSNIFKENWQMVFDPSASRPPLTEEEIEQEIGQKLSRFNIAPEEDRKIEKLKGTLALEALDSIVHEMQLQYQEVNSEFLKVKKRLSG